MHQDPRSLSAKLSEGTSNGGLQLRKRVPNRRSSRVPSKSFAANLLQPEQVSTPTLFNILQNVGGRLFSFWGAHSPRVQVAVPLPPPPPKSGHRQISPNLRSLPPSQSPMPPATFLHKLTSGADLSGSLQGAGGLGGITSFRLCRAPAPASRSIRLKASFC